MKGERIHKIAPAAALALLAAALITFSGLGLAKAGAETAGSGTTGNEAAGSGTADNETAGSGTAGTGTADNETAGSGTAGTGTADNGTAGSGTGTSDNGTAVSGAAAEQETGGIADIRRKGFLVAGLPKDDLLAFYEQDENGNMSGVDVMLASSIAQSLGVEIVFNREAANNDELTRLLQDGEIDMIAATYSRTLERSLKVKLSQPYLSIGMAVMINKQAVVQRGVSGNPAGYLKGAQEKIAVIEGTSHVAMCRELFPSCEIVEVSDYEEAAQLVKDNKVFAYFCGELEFYSEICRDRELQIYTDVYVFSDIKDEFCVAVSRDNEELLDYVNLYLDMSQEITIDQIHDRYRQYFTNEEAQDE